MTPTLIAALYLALACLTVDPPPRVTPAEANALPVPPGQIDRSQIPAICRELNRVQDYFPSINPR